MKKYIRTKDGHIFPYQGTDKNYIYQEYGEFKCSPIIQRASTIEELCDEFVYCKMLITKEDVKEILDSEDYKCKEIYGAIWVFDSNGTPTLKSVAKMNENGGLELL